MTKKTRLTLSSLSLLAAMMVPAAAEPRDPPGDTWVGVKEVLAAPFDYDGKTVTIKGWATIQREFYGIWASQADYENRVWRHCIALLNLYADDGKNKALNQSDVLVTGVFSRDSSRTKHGRPIVRLGACNEAGIHFIGPDGLRKFATASD
ncbi:hypothetical protein LK540_19015 [Massilia sp. IC2-278]|uniref:hypothetical protein n=1 Tax=Massilia sp. IC2-278 TaxID=2887200 RepID=UPI001E493ED7|nr:hypothetical protein [Massilia sp. IC2-278]MCC2962523.1 hypothetical protein [Massilia sp. IC2-278]